MPRLTNNSLAGLGLNSDVPLPASTAITTAPSSVVGGTGTLAEALATAMVASSSTLPVITSEASGPLSLYSSPGLDVSSAHTAARLAMSWSAAFPSSVPSVCSPPASLNPLPYVPPHPWPSASFSQLPGTRLTALQPTVSSLSSSPMFRPPFCVYNPVLSRASQVVNSIPQPAFSHLVNSIPQPAVGQFPVLGQALGQAQPPSSQYGQGIVPLAPFNPTLAMPPPGLADAAGMFASVPRPLEAFIVGPGYLPIPAKTVTTIISGHFVDLASLLTKPHEPLPSGPVISIDGRVVVSHPPKQLRRLTDIAQWAQAFSIYSLVLVSYFPGRAVDLLKYQLLILRTQAQFGGLAWLNYDEAFRRDAAARHLFDWSSMHVELYNFHTVAARVPPPVTRALPESSGARFATAICRSWNSGRCICLRPTCRYLHVCDTPRCRGPHRRIHCPTLTPNSPAAPPSLLSLPPPSSG